MVLWFITIGAHRAHVDRSIEPHVLDAVNPIHAVQFFVQNRYHGFVVLGSVFLVVTGGEALYADMGHFGAGPIRLAWFGMVMPGLLLNYFGQGALLLHASRRPPSRRSTASCRRRMVVPLVVLSTVAAVIASQALISAVFSLTRQAVQLGYSPRVEIRHTSATTIGQIYVPSGQLGARRSRPSRSSSASSRRARWRPPTASRSRRRWAITTMLAYVVARQVWHWSRWTAGVAHRGLHHRSTWRSSAPTLLKILHGGWVPLVIAALVFSLLSTWKTGRAGARRAAARARVSVRSVPQGSQRATRPHRVPGTAIFMTGSGAGVPPTLLHNLRHNKVLHAQRRAADGDDRGRAARVDGARASSVEPLSAGFFRVTLRYGFMEEPSVPEAISDARARGLPIDKDDITYFLGRETLLAGEPSRHGAVARKAVRVDVAQRHARDGVLQNPAGARRRARDAGGAVGTCTDDLGDR